MLVAIGMDRAEPNTDSRNELQQKQAGVTGRVSTATTVGWTDRSDSVSPGLAAFFSSRYTFAVRSSMPPSLGPGSLAPFRYRVMLIVKLPILPVPAPTEVSRDPDPVHDPHPGTIAHVR